MKNAVIGILVFLLLTAVGLGAVLGPMNKCPEPTASPRASYGITDLGGYSKELGEFYDGFGLFWSDATAATSFRIGFWPAYITDVQIFYKFEYPNIEDRIDSPICFIDERIETGNRWVYKLEWHRGNTTYYPLGRHNSILLEDTKYFDCETGRWIYSDGYRLIPRTPTLEGTE